MASSLPSPVLAAIGVVPAVLDGVRRLPGKAVQLPVIAISNALTGLDALRREYDDLTGRGERLVARLHGEVVERADDLEDNVQELVRQAPSAVADVAGTVSDTLADATEAVVRPAAGFAAAVADTVEDTVEDVVADVKPLVARAGSSATKAAGTAATTVAKGADALADTVEAAADKAADTAADAAATAAETVTDTVEATADTVEAAADTVGDAADRAVEAAAAPPEAETPDAEAPKGVPTPKAVEPDHTRVESAASPSVQEVVELVTASSVATPVDHDDLPLPDYDHMTLGSLRGRLRALSVDQLATIRTYEKAHASRLPVVTMLDNRIAKLTTDASAAPSGPVSVAPAPEQQAAAAGPSGAISPATTDAPPVNAPSHGNPTSAAQPRS